MFLESQIDSHINKGSIEVICGSMFSGKTEELLRRLKRAEYAKLKTAVFKPKIDVRYDPKNVVSHNANTKQSTTVSLPSEILKLVENIEVIAIDEAQFFKKGLVDVANKLANRGKRVIIAGLDMDYLGAPFAEMPQLMAIAESVTKVHAICVDCGRNASYSFRLIKSKKLVTLGEQNEYKPLCRNCFRKNST